MTIRVGANVRVTVDQGDYLKGFAAYIPRKYVIEGKVVRSLDQDDAHTIRIATGKKNHPYAVITLGDNVTIDTKTKKQKFKNLPVALAVKTWEIQGSSSTYIVLQQGDTWSCECKGFSFRGYCKHIKEAKLKLSR